MQGVRRCAAVGGLTLDVGGDDESRPGERRVERVIRENPVVIFSTSSSCCMSHVMRRLLSTLGAHPTLVQLDHSDDIRGALADGSGATVPPPAVYIGGRRVGGLESLMALHLSGELTAMLRQLTTS
ncbi:hypothetical protein Sjap_011705 [Stephania japonica]|uniref:Glutaredoxin domain-containing protein n=1 Tax=Stephania japonica TaxID=461633 RepID=A0AAP0JC11_9MAGN